MPPFVCMLLLLSLLPICSGWQKWNYNAFPTDDWRATWGYDTGPRGRRGHSIVLYGTKVSPRTDVLWEAR